MIGTKRAAAHVTGHVYRVIDGNGGWGEAGGREKKVAQRRA